MVTKKPRPQTVEGSTYKVRLNCGNLYITITHEDHNIFEVFAHLGKAGNCIHSLLEALTLCITMGIRHGVPIDPYIQKLTGVHCPTVSWDDGVKYLSCADAIGQILALEQQKLAAAAEEGGQGGQTGKDKAG